MSLLDNATLNLAARAKQKASDDYHNAWIQATSNIERLPVDRFWAILEYWKKEIIYLGRHDVSKYACDELFRRCICDQLEVDGVKVTFDELMSFIENYEAVTSALHNHLFYIVEGKGDDSYGDMCDSLPLIGREAVKQLLELEAGDDFEERYDNASVEKIIRANRGKHEEKAWYNFIWHGENYFRMFLGDEAERRYVREACDHDPKPEMLDLV